MKGIIKLYDRLSSQRWVVGCVVGILLILSGIGVYKLQYQEDIFDFLQQDKEYTESMQVYSSLSEASRIVVIFEGQDPDTVVDAIEAFGEICSNAITQTDIDGLIARLHFMYEHLPYFITDEAYQLLEKVCDASSDTLSQLLYQNLQILSMPGTSFLGASIAADPLHLIPLSKGIAGQYAGAQTSFTSYDGYMMTADQHMGFAFVDSEYGSTETRKNAELVDTLQAQINRVNKLFPTLNMRLLGAPVIAVGNANCIKKDSMWAIIISVVLIGALLLYAFPRKRNILLIFVSVAFGWLMGMVALYLFVGSVSVIVLGIGAILIGISINYPLHILVHQRYTVSVRQTLEEVLSPLITGNITTVGAFMALIPLSSPALRQLGIFAASMLLGTILFCVFVLPHLMTSEPATIREIHLPLLHRITDKWNLQTHKKWLVAVSLALFVALAVYQQISHYPLFDANISHLNYMTPQQKTDFAWFASLSPVSNDSAYLASSARAELNSRLDRWNQFWQTHDAMALADRLKQESMHAGFRANAFDPFIQLITSPVQQVDLQHAQTLAAVWPGRFDVETLNRCAAQNLTDNFNYIGIVCSIIVLLFLCISFRSIALGLIAFVPMLLSWVLIIALMQVFNLQFNIVNIILATFIFGQGDDYTIFVVEGLLYEHTYGKKILDRYKQSIILSALVMLTAIGVLIFAQHPAMHTLGAVTLIGMSCVVLMAFIVPPVLFKLYKSIKKRV